MIKQETRILLTVALWATFLLVSGMIYALTQQRSASVETVTLPADAIHMQAAPTFDADDGITINIIANLTTAVQGFHIEIEYDPAVLRPIMQEQDVGLLGNLFPLATKARNEIVSTNTTSVVRMLYVQFSPLLPVIGTGTLATVRFEPLQEGKTVVRLGTSKAAEVIDGHAHYIPLTLGEPEVSLDIASDLSGTVGQGTGPALFSPLLSFGFLASLVGLGVMTLYLQAWKKPQKRRSLLVTRG